MTHRDAILELAGMVKVLALHVLLTSPGTDPRQRQMLQEMADRADAIVAGINGRTLENAA